MEDMKMIKLEDLFFYLFISWRTILICTLIFAILAGGLTCLRPQVMIPKAEDATTEVKLPDKLIPDLPPADLYIEEPLDPADRYSDAEIQQMIHEFVLRNTEATLVQQASTNLDAENIRLRESLEQDPYLQIDPKAKTNKQFRVLLRMDDDIQGEDFSASFFQQNLLSSYLSAIRGNVFATYLADESPLPLKSESIPRLVRASLEKKDTLLVKVTAADEELRETLYRNSLAAVQRLYDEHNISYVKHSMVIEEGADETVQDIGIETEIQAIQKKIRENEEKIAKNKEEINTLFLEDYRNKTRAERDAREREKLEAIQLLRDELSGGNAPAEEIDEVAVVLQTSAWNKIGITKLRDSFRNVLCYDIQQSDTQSEQPEDSDPFAAFHELKMRIMKTVLMQGREVSDNSKEIEFMPAPKPYKRNIALGMILGMMLGAFIAILRYWQDLAAYDISALAAVQKIPYIGKINVKHPKSKKKFGDVIDRIITKAFGKRYEEQKQADETEYVAHYIQNMIPEGKVVIPVSDKSLKRDITKKLQALLSSGSDEIKLVPVEDMSNRSETLQAVKEGDAILFLRDKSDDVNAIMQEPRIAAAMKKEILGVVEIDTKW